MFVSFPKRSCVTISRDFKQHVILISHFEKYLTRCIFGNNHFFICNSSLLTLKLEDPTSFAEFHFFIIKVNNGIMFLTISSNISGLDKTGVGKMVTSSTSSFLSSISLYNAYGCIY